MIVVGGASPKEFFLWEELHQRSGCCGRSFIEDVVVVRGASLNVLSFWYDCCGRSLIEGRADLQK